MTESLSHLPPGRVRTEALKLRAAKHGIEAVPKWYHGTHFRSTLEADWAATFDEFGWRWDYEPVALKLPDGTYYRPDFHLPEQKIWCEVKGPHNERLLKPQMLQAALGYEGFEWGQDLVVILRPPGPGEMAVWEGAFEEQDFVIVRCPECRHYCFMDFAGTWSCRRHLRKRREPNKFWGSEIYWPDEFPFTRAPHKGGS